MLNVVINKKVFSLLYPLAVRESLVLLFTTVFGANCGIDCINEEASKNDCTLKLGVVR